ncbi:uncharacterized protein LOC142095118 [Mixophyes fleayi]|uniref:uncharacterized protein LOC142095118 n=1 Tax=Mixophyes fleayi TaxID=3061075 RepID=UPI003F4D90DB
MCNPVGGTLIDIGGCTSCSGSFHSTRLPGKEDIREREQISTCFFSYLCLFPLLFLSAFPPALCVQSFPSAFPCFPPSPSPVSFFPCLFPPSPPFFPLVNFLFLVRFLPFILAFSPTSFSIMPRLRRPTSRPVRYRSPSPRSTERHFVGPTPPPSLPAAAAGPPPPPQRESSILAHASSPGSSGTTVLDSGQRGRSTRPAAASGSRMRRPRPPACSAVVSSASGSGGGDMPAGAPVSHTAGVMPASAQAAYVSPSRGSAGEGRVGVGSGPLVEERGSGLGVFIQCPITPPISALRGDMQTYNPPAPHQLHFPPSPFLPHSGRGSSWGAHHGGAPLFDMGPFRPYTPGTDRVQSVRLGQRHVGSDGPSRGNMEVFGDSPSAPVRPSLSRHVLPATGEWTYRSRRAPSPSGAYASTSQCRPGPTRDNLAYDYHHSSGGNTSQWSPPRRTQSRPSGFFEEPYRAPYDEVPPQRRVILGGYHSPSPILPSRLDPSGPALGLARRRLDYLPRSQLTAPLCVSEPVVANQEMRAVGGGRSGSESRDQRSAGIRVEPIPGSTDAQPGSASVVEAPVAAGNPAPHDHQAGIRGLVEQAVAPSTLRTYQVSWRWWSLFSGQKINLRQVSVMLC